MFNFPREEHNPEHESTALRSLREDLSHILRKDRRLGRGDRRMEVIHSKDFMAWDDELQGITGTRFCGSVRITFFERTDAAAFKLLYCADGKFSSFWRTFE
jgi:hypothetical protein